jgi:hypothetical protein
MLTPAAQEALGILRDGSQFQWYVIPLLAFATYVYAHEVEARNGKAVFAGLAFWGMDWFNETWNALVLHFSGHAPVWAAPGQTAYLILIGLNIEICLMFAVAGVVFVKLLPHDKTSRILGAPNRLVVAAAGSAFCVFVEYLLNAVGALTWDYAWWNRGAPCTRRQALFVGALLAFNAVCLVVFGVVLGWV